MCHGARYNRSVLQQIELTHKESVWWQYLPQCTHIAYAIGYTPSPYSRLLVDDERIDEEIEFDVPTSGFRRMGEGGMVKGVFGCGIAFPDMVKDPEGMWICCGGTDGFLCRVAVR